MPSLCLGTAEISLFEMTGAYSTFANSGIYMEPYFISRIEDKNGVVIESFTNSPKEILSEDKNVVMEASSGRYKQGVRKSAQMEIQNE